MTLEMRVDEYIPTSAGFWWCRVELDPKRFERSWVCCPGGSKEEAHQHAMAQAEMIRKEPRKEVAPVKEAVERPVRVEKVETRVVTQKRRPRARTRKIPAPEPTLSERSSLKERLKLRNQEVGAA